LRFDGAGQARSGFMLNRREWREWRDARFLVVGPNFGCGSSREHAVWGLMQLGIRAVLGTSFAGIFADNAANNGLLLVSLSDSQIGAAMACAADPDRNRLTVDLAAETVTGAGLDLRFAVDPLRRDALLRGLDAIGATLDRSDAIQLFQYAHFAANPWLT
jgi:3-isopropylmalate/(R)-2-methylmalate dehydratase small subunit